MEYASRREKNTESKVKYTSSAYTLPSSRIVGEKMKHKLSNTGQLLRYIYFLI